MLSETLRNFIDFYSGEFGVRHSYEEFKTYWWGDVLGLPKEKCRDIVYYGYAKSRIFTEIEPVDGAKEAIAELSGKHELIIITGRPIEWKQETEKWLDRHFPSVFKKVIYANTYLNLGNIVKKERFMKEEGADVIIEDDLFFAEDIAKNGFRVILFDKPWNQDGDKHENLIRVGGWKEAVRVIDGM